MLGLVTDSRDEKQNAPVGSREPVTASGDRRAVAGY
jgi:hypothetical protein